MRIGGVRLGPEDKLNLADCENTLISLFNKLNIFTVFGASRKDPKFSDVNFRFPASEN